MTWGPTHLTHWGPWPSLVSLAVIGALVLTAAGCSVPDRQPGAGQETAVSAVATSPDTAAGSTPAPSASAPEPSTVPVSQRSSLEPAVPPLLSRAVPEAAPTPARVPFLIPVPMPDPKVLEESLDEALAVSDGTMTASVMDLRTGQTLYALDEDTPAVPASTVKILTAVAALQVLGPDHRFATSARARPAAGGSGGNADTEVVLDAGGDVLLGTGGSDPDIPDGHAGLGTLAAQSVDSLIERGATGTVAVRLDDSGYEGPALSQTWSTGMVASGNIAPVQPIATYGARTEPGTGSERVPDPALFAAQAFHRQLTDHAAAEGADFTVAPGVERLEEEQDHDDGAPATDGAPTEDPAARPGAVPGESADPPQEVTTGDLLASVESATVDEQAAHMLQTSDNQVAEALGRNLAKAAGEPGSFTGSTRAVVGVLEELGVDTDGLALQDASGLSTRNRITARQLTESLWAAGQTPELHAAVTGLPAAGEEGTMEERMAGTTAEGDLRAKTGTLSGVAALSGEVVTDDGRRLVFSFLANGQSGGLPGLAPAREAMDAAAVALAGCGCHPEGDHSGS